MARKAWQWLSKYGLTLAFVSIIVGLLGWFSVIASGDGSQKPGWLLIPLTAIYALSSLYMAAGAIQAAQASRKSADVMEQSLREIRLSRIFQYSPYISFPQGFRYELRSDGCAAISLRNLFNAPIISLYMVLWEMEDSPDGKVLKYSSLRESVPRDYAANETDITVVLSPSQRTEEEKVNSARQALQGFQGAFGRGPLNSLCVTLFSIRGNEVPAILYNDLEFAETLPAIKHHTAS